MTRLSTAATFLSTVLTVACTSTSTPPSAVDDLESGHADAEHVAVGQLTSGGGEVCTGTLIAPDVVLTAAHCVDGPYRIDWFIPGAGDPHAPLASARDFGARIHVVKQAQHPRWKEVHSCPSVEPDVALYKLAHPVDGITPMRFARIAPRIGDACEVVGFGVHTEHEQVTVGERRTGTERVVALADNSIELAPINARVNHGDSGGPILCENLIVGVASCGALARPFDNYYARIDTVATWVEEQMAAWAVADAAVTPPQ